MPNYINTVHLENNNDKLYIANQEIHKTSTYINEKIRYNKKIFKSLEDKNEYPQDIHNKNTHMPITKYKILFNEPNKKSIEISSKPLICTKAQKLKDYINDTKMTFNKKELLNQPINNIIMLENIQEDKILRVNKYDSKSIHYNLKNKNEIFEKFESIQKIALKYGELKYNAINNLKSISIEAIIIEIKAQTDDFFLNYITDLDENEQIKELYLSIYETYKNTIHVNILNYAIETNPLLFKKLFINKSILTSEGKEGLNIYKLNEFKNIDEIPTNYIDI